MAAELREIVPPDSALAFPAMRALRTHYEDEGAFVERVDGLQRGEGYRMVGVFEEEPHALAVAGFRVAHMLAWGRYLYVDDLSTLPRPVAGATEDSSSTGSLRKRAGKTAISSTSIRAWPPTVTTPTGSI